MFVPGCSKLFTAKTELKQDPDAARKQPTRSQKGLFYIERSLQCCGKEQEVKNIDISHKADGTIRQ